jgi:hypothetical protein
MRNLLLLTLLLLTKIAFAQHSDCISAMDICKKKVYHVDKTGGEGSDKAEADFIPCFMNGDNLGQAEENSTWIKFEIAKSGNLAFAITPHRLDDDIDFVVFRLPASGDCKNKQIVRCMAAGYASEDALLSPCMGETGLRVGERASNRDAGCSDKGDNTWLAPLQVLKGERYVILISNVSTAGPGFSIRFSGTAKLPCDDEPEKPEIKKKPVVKPKEKPKPKPIEKPVEKPVEVVPPPVLVANVPKEIGGRTTKVEETVSVKSNSIKIKIWDSQLEDGDVISVYLNDKKIIDHLKLTIKPKEFVVELPAGSSENYLTVYSDDFGKSEPNTASVRIIDGAKEQTIELVSGRSKQESIKIVKN